MRSTDRSSYTEGGGFTAGLAAARQTEDTSGSKARARMTGRISGRRRARRRPGLELLAQRRHPGLRPLAGRKRVGESHLLLERAARADEVALALQDLGLEVEHAQLARP